MGGESSKPLDWMVPESLPPITVQLPYPLEDSQKEIVTSDAEACTTCDLDLLQSGASTATVQLTRHLGGISTQECQQYDIDKKRAEAKELSMFEFASRIHQGFYYTSKESADGYCRELGMSDANLQSIAQGEAFTESMLIYKRARPVTGTGGFSAETKAILELAIPVELAFTGVASYLKTSEDKDELPQLSLPGFEAVARVRESFSPMLLSFFNLRTLPADGTKQDASKSGAGDGTKQDASKSRAWGDIFGIARVAEARKKLQNLGPNDYPWASSTPTQGVPTRTPIERRISVKYISLYHPFPLRVDGVQYDAAIALNDPSVERRDSATVVLIPLKISQTGDEASAAFVRQIARYLPAVRDIDPMTGVYPRATIPTGSSWSIAQLFNLPEDPPKPQPLLPLPGDPKATEVPKDEDTKPPEEKPKRKPSDRVTVTNGFYLWMAPPEYVPMQKFQYTDEPGLAGFPGNKPLQEIVWNGWQPSPGRSATLYLMLDAPRAIDSTDFVTLSRMLPATPPEQAIHGIPKYPKYVYHKEGSPPPGGPEDKQGGCVAESSNLCAEPFVNFNSTIDLERAKAQYDTLQKSLEGDYSTTRFARDLTNCPGAKCDVFLQNLKQAKLPDHRIVVRVLYSVLFFLALLVGIYFALAAAARGYDDKVATVGETFGKLAGLFARRWQMGVTQATPSAPTSPPGPGFFDRVSSFFRRSKAPQA